MTTHTHPYDPDCRICQLLDPDPLAPPTANTFGQWDSTTYTANPTAAPSAMFCARCDHPMHWHECFVATRAGAVCRCRNDVALDPDPLSVPDELPTEKARECWWPNGDCHFTAPDDTGSDTWFGCLMLMAAFGVGFIVRGIVGMVVL